MKKLINLNKKYKALILITLGVILLALLLLIATKIYVVNNGASATSSSPEALNDDREGIDGTYESMSREEILADLQQRQQVVTDQVSSNVIFLSGDAGTKGEWVLQNPESNSVIQQAEIYYGDDNILIGKTVPVKPGQYINTVELLEDMESGEYEALVYINYYNVNDKAFAGKAGYKVHLTIG